MYVAPESAGHGLGRALLEEAITRAKQQEGVEALLLTVTASNLRARRLYEAFGFQVYGVEARALRVDDRYLDDALMVLHLNSPAAPQGEAR